MEFFNGTTFDEIIDQDVEVFLRTNTPTITAIKDCRTFVRDGQVWIDLMPHVAGKYVMALPEDAGISRNDVDPSVRRYGILVLPNTPQGRMVQSLIDAKKAATN